MKYAMWAACERFGVRPPGVKPDWDDMDVEAQADLLAYHQVAEHDETASSPFGGGKKGGKGRKR
jgi:hypothetical protein